MIYLIVWWALVVLIGFATLPVTMWFLRFLPDRGYALAKPVGLLLWVYPFWLLAVFGFIHNSVGALVFLLALTVIASWGVLRGRGQDSVLAWLREHWRYMLIVEVVFGIALLAFAYYRAFNPEISGTEKPMEFMFLNSILASDTFPPRDAWLSGYAISYYYLGYVIVAALAKLGNIPSSYAFNLGLIMTFALTAVGAFGLTFNIVKRAQKDDEDKGPRRSRAPYVFGVIAVFLVLVIGNLQGVVEVAYNANIGSREFYKELNLHSLDTVEPSGTGIPEDYYWWWRASRVLNDKSPVDGSPIEVIDEFPAFSFLLGDLHPHVLALPFCVLALAVAFNLFLSGTRAITNIQEALGSFLRPRMLLTALLVGALGMLNTWDIVTYGVVIAAVFAIVQYRAAGKVTAWMLASSIAFLVLLFVGGYVLFLPFYLGFTSQARGVMPQLTKTPLHQYLIMFGFFIFVIASLVILLISHQPNKRRMVRDWIEFALPLLAVPLVIALGGALAVTFVDSVRDQIASALNLSSPTGMGELLGIYFGALLGNPGVFVLLVLLIGSIAALGRMELFNKEGTSSRTVLVFALLLALIGLILTFGTEFLFIRDTFGSRMNTVFKLYYQAWLLLAMAATIGAFYVWHTARGAGRAIWIAAFGVLFAASLVYSAFAFPTRANYFNAQETPPTLDGWRWVQNTFPDDYAGIEWVRSNVPRDAIILEAAGDQYSFDDRVSVATGIPTLVGWGGHELQWRGTDEVYGPRTQDVEEIYKSRDLKQTQDLLTKYNVDYVIVGGIERKKYQLNSSLVDKFGKIGDMVFEQGSMRIYRVGQVTVSARTP